MNGRRDDVDPQPALTTEHFTLQGARSQTMSESSARASVYADRPLDASAAEVEPLFPSPAAEVGRR